ncbi:Pyridoxamine 5'-phosphate oxidase [Microbacterium azadirachtae]|uniref:Pyridoxamine 5'-phosphate oxidase n=1 Tax=Microbacterium azadirachtae TaxID=582680 RepID=A0A0F0LSI4_9MICO|nr:pyridoxamine 5'-phosphate oxidase family protein [Microbacterium azadirachtae]KJL35210.1 Pyridoxamine 5'-phosphate oxidase [Microbacterium azadirachtae]
MEPTPLRTLVETVRRERRGVLATTAADGAPEAALVGIAVLDDGTLIVNAPSTARKVAHLRVNPRAALVIGAGDVRSLQVEGRAQLLEGDDRARLGAAYDAQLPGSRSLAEGFILIMIRPEWMRDYDVSREPRAVEATFAAD